MGRDKKSCLRVTKTDSTEGRAPQRKFNTSGPTVPALLNESDPKGRKTVPQGHQDRLYRSRAQQQKQASRSPTTTSQKESTQKGSRTKPEVESSKNKGQKGQTQANQTKNPTTYSHLPWPYVKKT